MRRQEKIQRMHVRAKELARGGECSGWHSVEMALRAEGYPEARSELDRSYLRAQLDDICEKAQSPEEAKNREDYQQWMENEGQGLIRRALAQFPGLSVYFSQHESHISGENGKIDISKSFGTRKLNIIRHFLEGDQWYVSYTAKSSEAEFQDISEDDIATLIRKYVEPLVD